MSVSGTAERPRLAVFRSNKHMYAQLIDDMKGATIVSASDIKESKKKSMDKAREVGEKIASAATGKKIKKVVFDRAGFIYTGRIKTFAEAARKGGLEF